MDARAKMPTRPLPLVGERLPIVRNPSRAPRSDQFAYAKKRARENDLTSRPSEAAISAAGESGIAAQAAPEIDVMKSNYVDCDSSAHQGAVTTKKGLQAEPEQA